MIDHRELFRALYLLAADDGREAALFGTSKDLALQAFDRSVVGNSFPVIWFELPLIGPPRFDLHLAFSHEALRESSSFASGAGNGYDQLFAWYGNEECGGNGLAFAYDTGDGRIEQPAVHVNVNHSELEDMDRFFELAADAAAAQRYRDFVAKLPEAWRVWYAGVHPGRPESPVRVDCFVLESRKNAYQRDLALFEEDLRSCGFTAFGTAFPQLAGLILDSPFGLELQFDVLHDGSLGPTLGLSASLPARQSGAKLKTLYEEGGNGAKLLAAAESLGIADERWRHIAGTVFTTAVPAGERFYALSCYPTFVKLRMREGKALDAKVYLEANAIPFPEQ